MGKRSDDVDEVIDGLTGDAAGSNTSKRKSSRGTRRKTDDTAAATSGGTSDAETDAIVEDIAVTREEMGGTLEALGTRLDPQTLMSEAQERAVETASEMMDQARETVVVTATTVMEQARDTVHDATVGRVEEMVESATTTAQETGNAVVRVVRENPVPAALAGIGLWMLWQKYSAQRSGGTQRTSYASPAYGMGGTSPAYPGYPAYGGYPAESGSGMAGGAQQGVRDMASGAQQGIGNVASGAQQGVSNVAGRVQDTAASAAGTVQDAAANLTGTVQGVVGSAASTVQQAAGGAAEAAQQTAGAVVERAGEAVSQVGQTANQAVTQLGSTATDVWTDLRLGAMRAQEAAGRTMQQNPLAAGATAVALGAVVGLALPSTRKEQELLGGARDAALERVADKVEEATPNVEQAISGNGSESIS
jgi:hypothetical protein